MRVRIKTWEELSRIGNLDSNGHIRFVYNGTSNAFLCGEMYICDCLVEVHPNNNADSSVAQAFLIYNFYYENDNDKIYLNEWMFDAEVVNKLLSDYYGN